MTFETRRFGTLRAAAGLAHGLALVPAWLLSPPLSPAARDRERLFMQRVARRIVEEIRLHGAPPAGPGTLYIANHVSWLDIAVLGGALDAAFIAKMDVRKWPVIGPLSRRTGTVFVEREARHHVHHQADAIARRLRAGQSLVLFPEGTTSDGTGVMPFRSSLFEAAQHARTIQPLALGYHHGDGRRIESGLLPRVGWTGDEALLPNLARVCGFRLSAEVRLMPSFAVTPDMDRKMLAARCREAVLEAFREIRGGGAARDEPGPARS